MTTRIVKSTGRESVEEFGLEGEGVGSDGLPTGQTGALLDPADMQAAATETFPNEEERIDVSEESKEEIHKFIESMTTDQFQRVADFVREMPVVRDESSFVCQNCGANNEFEVRGMKSFF